MNKIHHRKHSRNYFLLIFPDRLSNDVIASDHNSHCLVLECLPVEEKLLLRCFLHLNKKTAEINLKFLSLISKCCDNNSKIYHWFFNNDCWVYHFYLQFDVFVHFILFRFYLKSLHRKFLFNQLFYIKFQMFGSSKIYSKKGI